MLTFQEFDLPEARHLSLIVASVMARPGISTTEDALRLAVEVWNESNREIERHAIDAKFAKQLEQKISAQEIAPWPEGESMIGFHRYTGLFFHIAESSGREKRFRSWLQLLSETAVAPSLFNPRTEDIDSKIEQMKSQKKKAISRDRFDEEALRIHHWWMIQPQYKKDDMRPYELK